MSSVPKSGVILYSKNIKALSQFYSEVFGMAVLRETEDFVSMARDDFNMVIHVPPLEIPDNNFNRLKVFLTVESSSLTREKVVALGGQALEGEWSNPVFKVCNIADPEGNHIQLREFR